MDFYSGKSRNLPRFFYRHLYEALKGLKGSEAQVEYINQAFADLATKQDSDYLKFIWFLPKYFQQGVSPEALARLEILLKEKRQGRIPKLKKQIYPHVSDEFSLEQDFLSEVFCGRALPTFSKQDRLFSIGSCFARNFSNFLQNEGIQAFNFGQAEDLNTPASNAVLLDFCHENDDQKLLDRLSKVIDRFWLDSPDEFRLKLAQHHFAQLRELKKQIADATRIVVTLGNIVDFYLPAEDGKAEEIAPKFIVMLADESIKTRHAAAARLQKSGAYLRLSRVSEVILYIAQIKKHIRDINPNAAIIFTVSPVPIDSVIGIREPLGMSAVEIDCVSKSIIRTAAYENFLSPEFKNDDQIFYLPSFEIVRWIAPVSGISIFGKQDAASRHVSNEILNAVCSFAYGKQS